MKPESGMRRASLTFAQAITRMRRGATLSLQYVRNKPVWELDSFAVAPEVATLLADLEPESGMKPNGGPQNVDADGYPEGWTGPLFPVGRTVDWNNPHLRQLGEKLAAHAYTLADDLSSYGADAEQLLLPREKRRTDRPWNLEIPPTLIDAVHAVLLSMPRPKERRGPRSRWNIKSVETMVKGGLSLKAAAKAEAARTGASEDTITRGVQVWRARKTKWREPS